MGGNGAGRKCIMVSNTGTGDGMVWYKSISVKVVLIVAGVVAVMTLVLSLLYLRIQRENLDNMTYQTAAMLSETIKKSIQNDMMQNRKKAAYKIVETIGRQEGIDKVRVIAANGEVLFCNCPREVGRWIGKQSEQCRRCHGEDPPKERLETGDRGRIFFTDNCTKHPATRHRVLGIINPLYNEPDCSTADCHAHPPSKKVLGVIDVVMDLSDVDVFIGKARNRVLGVGLLSVLLGCLIGGVAIVHFFRKPVRELVYGTDRVSKGDLSHTISVNTEDEMGQLARHFNQMTESLRNANAEITALVEGLNQMVDERTAELKETQEKLLDAEKLAHLGKIAATVAHEINNPLHGVFTYIRLMERKLQEGVPGPEQAAKFGEYLATMGREVERTSAIVFNLLEFTRPKAPNPKRVDLRKTIEESLVLVQNLLKSNRIEVRMEMQPAPEVEVDPAQIKQVFLNLLVNSCEAMETGGTLTIRSWGIHKDRTSVVEIGDTGPGIPEEHMRRIFDPFFTTKGKGTGIGLSVVRSIVQRHGGKVEVDTGKDRGTRFRIVLPVA